MHQFVKIFCSIVLIVEICYASTKTPPLNQLEGPWTIRNASENALPIIGKCPTMHIEPSPPKSGNDGIILWKTSIQTLTFSLVNVNQKVYQLFYRNNSRYALLGNVTVLHVEKTTFLITEVQTPEQTYFAVLTKDNGSSPDTDAEIEKTWNSTMHSKNIKLEPVENDNCQEEVIEETPMNEFSEATHSSSMLTTTTERVSSIKNPITISDKPLSNHPEISTEKKIITTNVTPAINNNSNSDINNTVIEVQSGFSTLSTQSSSEASWKNTETLSKYTERRGSGTTVFPSNSIVIINVLFFLINNVFIYV